MKTLILFGGSKGIGKEIVNKYKESYKIISIQRTKIKNTKNIIYHFFDLNNSENIPQLWLEISSQINKIDAVIFNASRYDNIKINDLNYFKIIQLFNTNLFSYMLFLKEIKQKLNKNSSIIFISSTAPRINYIGSSVYAPTQAGLESFAKVVTKELAPNTRVNVIAPGPTNTSLLRNNLKIQKLNKSEIIKNIPLKRLGKTKDVVNLIDFLLSEKSEYITGQIININGGVYI